MSEARRAESNGDRLAHYDGSILASRRVPRLASRRIPRRLAVGFLGDLVLLELLIEVAPRCIDDLGGLRDVPPVLTQLRHEIRPLGAVFELSQRPGAGLGLAACRLLADIMGDSVGIESAIGQGARFFLRLPLTIADAPTEVVTAGVYPINFACPNLIVQRADGSRSGISDWVSPWSLAVAQ